MKITFETNRLRMALLRRVARYCPALVPWLRYPKGFGARFRRPVINVGRDVGIGDVLMCTPTLRELKRRRPNASIHFYTDFPSLVRGLPYIDEVMPTSAAPADTVFLEYEWAVPSRLHLSSLIGDSFGLGIGDPRPDCVIDEGLADRFRTRWRDLPRPHIIVNRHASKHTPNKEWPASNWLELLKQLSQWASIIEIGAGREVADDFGLSYVDLRSRTSLDELVAAIAAADLHVGPPSGPSHIAAATGKPSVVIIGGYEGPANATYPQDIAFYTPVGCAPCWLRTPCPYGLKCLKAISVDSVETAVHSLWRRVLATGAEPVEE